VFEAATGGAADNVGVRELVVRELLAAATDGAAKYMGCPGVEARPS